MLRDGSVGASLKQKRNVTLTLTLNLLLPYIVFHKQWKVIFLRLLHFYGLFTAYLSYVEVMSVRLYVNDTYCIPIEVVTDSKSLYDARYMMHYIQRKIY